MGQLKLWRRSEVYGWTTSKKEGGHPVPGVILFTSTNKECEVMKHNQNNLPEAQCQGKLLTLINTGVSRLAFNDRTFCVSYYNATKREQAHAKQGH
jgi:hypothetical protein